MELRRPSFFGVNFYHPCAVLLEHLTRDPENQELAEILDDEEPHYVIHEYETVREVRVPNLYGGPPGSPVVYDVARNQDELQLVLEPTLDYMWRRTFVLSRAVFARVTMPPPAYRSTTDLAIHGASSFREEEEEDLAANHPLKLAKQLIRDHRVSDTCVYEYTRSSPMLEYMWMRMAHAAGAQRAMSLLAASFGLRNKGTKLLLPVVTAGYAGTRRADYDAQLLDATRDGQLEDTLPTLRGVIFIQLRCLDTANARLANGLTVVGYAALAPADRPHIVAHVDHILATLMAFQVRCDLGGSLRQAQRKLIPIDFDWGAFVLHQLDHVTVAPRDAWWTLPQTTDTPRDFGPEAERAWQYRDIHLFVRLPAYAQHDALPQLLDMPTKNRAVHLRWGVPADDPEWTHAADSDDSDNSSDEAPATPATRATRKRGAGTQGTDAERAAKKPKLKARLTAAADHYVHAMLGATLPGQPRTARIAALAAHARTHGRLDVADHLDCLVAAHRARGGRRH
jgi:hypothetical protein